MKQNSFQITNVQPVQHPKKTFFDKMRGYKLREQVLTKGDLIDGPSPKSNIVAISFIRMEDQFAVVDIFKSNDFWPASDLTRYRITNGTEIFPYMFHIKGDKLRLEYYGR